MKIPQIYVDDNETICAVAVKCSYVLSVATVPFQAKKSLRNHWCNDHESADHKSTLPKSQSLELKQALDCKASIL